MLQNLQAAEAKRRVRNLSSLPYFQGVSWYRMKNIFQYVNGRKVLPINSYLFRQGDPVTAIYIAVDPSTTVKSTYFKVTKNVYQDLPGYYSNTKAIFRDPKKEKIVLNPHFQKNTNRKVRTVLLEVASAYGTFGLEDIVNGSLIHSYSV